MHRRYLALWLPLLPLDRLRRLEPALAAQPLATWATFGNRRALVAADGPAIHPDQALADAQAICPTLVLRPADPVADADLLERLALWALRWTPLAAVDGVDGLLLDVAGVTALSGGEAALLQAVRTRFQLAGFAVRAALAGSAEAAAALARSGADGRIVPPGEDLPAVTPLPLAALRLPPEVVLGLSRLGLHSIGDALRQPRGPLARRFGRVLLDALDGVSGARTRPLRPVRVPARFLAAQDCLEPIITRPAIEHVLEALLVKLCDAMRDAGRGARRLTLRAFRVDGAVQELAIGTGAASREPSHLRHLFRDVLEQLEPDLGFERLTLEAQATDPLEGIQTVLRGEGGGGGPNHSVLLAELIDRLSQRSPVHRLRPLDSHWPEYAAAPAAPFESIVVPADWGLEPRPVRLLGQPLPLAVTALVPDGPPAQLRCGALLYRVQEASGPERLEPEWWGEDADRPARDYYCVQTLEGPRLWICRLLEPETGGSARWFLHGFLA
jgi:protein ImuB